MVPNLGLQLRADEVATMADCAYRLTDNGTRSWNRLGGSNER
jgi:hypothetical protein